MLKKPWIIGFVVGIIWWWLFLLLWMRNPSAAHFVVQRSGGISRLLIENAVYSVIFGVLWGLAGGVSGYLWKLGSGEKIVQFSIIGFLVGLALFLSLSLLLQLLAPATERGIGALGYLLCFPGLAIVLGPLKSANLSRWAGFLIIFSVSGLTWGCLGAIVGAITGWWWGR